MTHLLTDEMHLYVYIIRRTIGTLLVFLLFFFSLTYFVIVGSSNKVLCLFLFSVHNYNRNVFV